MTVRIASAPATLTLLLLSASTAAGFLPRPSPRPRRSRAALAAAAGGGGGAPLVGEDEATASSSAPARTPVGGEEEAASGGPDDAPAATTTQRRALGSQELLMLPRQYPERPHVTFPQMNHVAAFVLSSTPSIELLTEAIDGAVRAHPLLRARVEGTSHPEDYKDLMRMVRKGDPDPCTFVAPPFEEAGVRAEDRLELVDVPSWDRADLDESWRGRFLEDVDDPGSWCDVRGGKLWKMELHRLRGPDDAAATNGEAEDEDEERRRDAPCALVVTTNHVISDQGSLNVVMDQILSDLSDLEREGRVVHPAVEQPLPVALEDSVLGLGRRFSDVRIRDASLRTIQYLSAKAAEIFKSPALLPDAEGRWKEDGGGALGAAEIIAGMMPGGLDDESSDRKTTIQYRTLSEEATSALLRACRKHRVAMSSALAAAVTVATSDFIDGGVPKEGKSRNYKVLQSLDMRRFGAKLDECRTLSCQAGSMDMMLGPVPDRLGERIRGLPSGPEREAALREFWDLSKESFLQTMRFLKSGMPEEAVRVFDAGMTISEMNQLVHMESKSKDSQGRAYSAGITNAGVYGRGKAVRRRGVEDAGDVQDERGRYRVLDVFYATSHARTGCLYPISCLTVGGRIQCSFNPPSPLVSAETNERFADAYIELLETVAGVRG